MYMLMGLLGLLLGTMLMRYVVWAVVYITTASHLWILPNLTSETVSEALLCGRPCALACCTGVLLPEHRRRACARQRMHRALKVTDPCMVCKPTPWCCDPPICTGADYGALHAGHLV